MVVLHCLLHVYHGYFVCSLKSTMYTKFHLDRLAFVSANYSPIYVPIIMYVLRLFIVVLQ